MLTLEIGQTLRAVAGTAGVIDYTLQGDVPGSTVDVFGLSGIQGSLPNTLTTLYTSSGVATLLNEMNFVNTSASTVSNVDIYQGARKIAHVDTFPAKGSLQYNGKGWQLYDSNMTPLYVGSIGPTGATGSTGPTGPTGSTGPAGVVQDVADVGTNKITVTGTAAHPLLTVNEANLTTPFLKSAGVLAGTGASAYRAGGLDYDTVNDSLTFYNSDSNVGLQIGQEDWVRVKNSTGSTIAAGVAVYVNGTDGANNMPTVALARADAAATAKVAGVTTESIANGSVGFITAFGLVHGLNTSGFSAGVPLYLSAVTAGLITATAPTTPNYPVQIGNCLTSNAITGAINVAPTGQITQALSAALAQIAALNSAFGQTLTYGPSGWQGTTTEYSVTSFGADPSGSGDSTLGFFNSIISCLIQPSLTPASSRAIVSAQTTTGATFTLPVAANSLPSTGTLHAQTTQGLIGFTYTGGGTTSLACTTTYGWTGGLILNGSLVGIANTIIIGGIVNIPAGFYVTSYPVYNNIPGIWFKGAGGSTTHDVGAWPSGGGSWISQRGAVQGLPVLLCAPISGTAGIQGGQVLGGMRITGLNADCTNANGYMWCSVGFAMISTSGEYMEDLFVYNAAKTAYEFSTLGATMLSEAADQTRGTHINIRFRQLEGKSTAANISAAGLTNPAAVTNLNALAASTVTLSGAPNANWDTAGMAKVQAIDQLTGNVCWYLVAYTGISGSTLTGCTAISQYANQTNSTTLNAATPASGNFKPNALMFAGSKIVPAQGAFGEGITWHGSATANACCGVWINLVGSYFMGSGLYSANSDSQKVINPVFNRTTAGTPTGVGVELHGSTFSGASGASGSSRNQVFIGGDPGAGGCAIWGVGQLGYQQPASAITWDNYELGNGAPRVVAGTGVDLAITYNGGLVPALHDRVVSATGNAATVGGAGAAGAVGLLPNMFVIFPPQAPAVGASGYFDAILSKGAAGTSVQLGLKYGIANSAADATVATGTAWTGTAVADILVVRVYWTLTIIGASAICTAYLIPIQRQVEAAVTGWVTTVAAYRAIHVYTTTAFNSALSNPGPAYLGLHVLANTGTVVSVLPGSASRVVSA